MSAPRIPTAAELSAPAVARFLDAYWTLPATERERFLRAMEQRAEKWSDEWTGPDPGSLVGVALIEKRNPDDPRRNLRPAFRVVR